jgi:hypothetical protein
MFLGSASEFLPPVFFYAGNSPRHEASGRKARRAGGGRVIEFPYLVMFRNENGHFVSVGGDSEFKTEKEASKREV